MKYTIKTTDAQNLINIILDCVKNGKDKDDSEIQSWGVKETTEDEKVLVHTPQQWDQKGCLSLIANKDNDEIEVKFYYWEKFPKEERNENDKRYVYGRCIELLLNHFPKQITKIEIIP